MPHSTIPIAVETAEIRNVEDNAASKEDMVIMINAPKRLVECLAKTFGSGTTINPTTGAVMIDFSSVSKSELDDMSKLLQKLGNQILVPGGQVKNLDRDEIQAAGPAEEFWLFPNLPAELRLKVYDLATDDGMIDVLGSEIVERRTVGGTNELVHKWLVQGVNNIRFMMMLVNKEAHIHVVDKTFRGLEVFGSRGVLLKPSDNVHLHLEAKLIESNLNGIATMIRDRLHIVLISHLTFYFRSLGLGVVFARENLKGFRHMKSINFTTPMFARGNRSFDVAVSFLKIAGDRSGLRPRYNLDGEELVGYTGLAKFGEIVKFQPDHQAIMDMWNVLNRRIGEFSTVPDKLELSIHFQPYMRN